MEGLGGSGFEKIDIQSLEISMPSRYSGAIAVILVALDKDSIIFDPNPPRDPCLEASMRPLRVLTAPQSALPLHVPLRKEPTGGGMGGVRGRIFFGN